MPDFLNSAFTAGPSIAPLAILLRLVVALMFGCAVAWIYLRSSRDADIGPSFPITLVLLAVLIAMVTEVIGNNVARAFSLVGALSIVRFRTVVRDTRDTAYVIFAVIVGMAVGAANVWVALLGLVVVGAGSLLLPARVRAVAAEIVPIFVLRMRVPLGHSPDGLAGAVLEHSLQSRELVAIATNKLGASLDYSYEVQLAMNGSLEALVEALSLIEGVQDVRIERRPVDRL